MSEIPKGTIKRVVINRHVIASNHKHGRTDPPISIQTSRSPVRARTVAINGPSQVVYRPDKPLGCGAKLWVETRARVEYE